MTNFYLNLFGLLLVLLSVICIVVFCVKLLFFYIKKKPFPKYSLIVSLTGIITVVTLFLYTQYFFTFNNLEGELYKGPVVSPDGKYTANAYYMTYGGAAGGVNLWVEISHNDETNRTETVYFSDAKSEFSIEWMDEDTVFIKNDDPEYLTSNRSIELQIGKEIYHDNGLACKSLLMKDKYETCYQN